MEIRSCALQLAYFSWTPALLFSFLMTRVISSRFSLILLPFLNAACVWLGFSRPDFASWPFSYMVHHELRHSYRVSHTVSDCVCPLKCLCWSPNPECDGIWRWGLTDIPRFIMLHFRADTVLLQIEGSRQPRVKQVYRGQFSSCIFSLCICVSHFGTSYSISKGLPKVAQWERISLPV